MGRVYDLERERLRRQGKPVPPGMFTQSELHRVCRAFAAKSVACPLDFPKPSRIARAWQSFVRWLRWWTT